MAEPKSKGSKEESKDVSKEPSDRKKLLELFSLLRVGLADESKAGVKPQECAFNFVKGRILTHNGEIAVSAPVPKKLEAMNGKAVPGKPLLQLLDRLSDKSVEVEVDEKEVRFKSGRIRAGVPFLELLDETKDFSKKVRRRKGAWTEVQSDFSYALSFCSYSCGKDMSVPALTCVNVRGDDGIIEASDNYRASRYSLKSFPAACLIPAANIKEISGYTAEGVCHEDPWLHLQVGKSVISLRTFEAQFPDMDAAGIFKKYKGETKFELPETIDEVLERAAIFAARDYFLDERIAIKLAKKRMSVRAEGHQGWLEETVEVAYKDEEKTFDINPNFLKEILTHTRECSLTKTRLQFQGKSWTHVVSLPRKG